MKKMTDNISGLFLMLLLVLSVPIFGVYASSKSFRDFQFSQQSLNDITHGHTSYGLERIYKDTFVIRDFSVGLLNLISFGIFDEARKGIVAGADHWLYSDEEFTWTKQSDATVDAHIALVSKYEKELASRNIQLVVALVPEKADIYSEHLGHIASPANRKGYYEKVRDRLLKEAGVLVPDIRESMRMAKSGGDVFLKTDTHWTVLGADAAAKAIAEALATNGGLTRTQFQETAGEPVQHHGDLYRYADLGPFTGLISQPDDTLTPVSANPANGDVDALLADPSTPGTAPEIALVGTSYSANKRWSFEAKLKMELSADVLNLAEEGKGPFVPMRTFMEKTLDATKGLKIVIWEIPLRYMDEPKVSGLEG